MSISCRLNAMFFAAVATLLVASPDNGKTAPVDAFKPAQAGSKEQQKRQKVAERATKKPPKGDTKKKAPTATISERTYEKQQDDWKDMQRKNPKAKSEAKPAAGARRR